ncbi:MAG: hypothetical protein IJG46_04105 [Prevotella sp.]|nr:hypothetical protein [Prevotella sp.]
MDGEEKPKKTKKKKSATEGEGSGEKEHKPNWREVYATYEDIKDFLRGHVYLRYNTIKYQVEARLPSGDPFCCNGELAEFVKDEWQPMTDRLESTLLIAVSAIKPTQRKALQTVLGSGFVPDFHPFLFYLNRLPPWDGQDYIMELSVSVTVSGGIEKQMLFYEMLKKWLVAMVASWVDEDIVNHLILALIGKQGSYKTTWFSMLLPPELRRYFRIKVNASQNNRDDLITVATYGLLCYEELDVMKRTEQNTMKSVVTMPAIDERKPYGHHTEHMPHVASFCATGNNLQFLNDQTGSRRWMPFEVESIRDPRTHPFNHAGIFAQAYALYHQGFRYWLEDEEEEVQKAHNEDFETPDPVREAIEEHFRKPGPDEVGEYLSATQILKVISDHPVMRFSTETIGVAMKNAGFEYKRTNGKRGYRVVAYKPYEMEANRRDLAEVAKKEEEAGSDTCDTFF